MVGPVSLWMGHEKSIEVTIIIAILPRSLLQALESLPNYLAILVVDFFVHLGKINFFVITNSSNRPVNVFLVCVGATDCSLKLFKNVR